ncbi:acetylxylan esterase like protein [Zymoseptoria brevis]|uniref:Acetylxylan esterase like protein n=1 Tax=Zymoseptoria brevis TaxID=1047168 RepID=A0A0F4GGX7_9PEZI|nr:acetylxylan esterase like protein [Zymoseptoria brevis]
MFHSTLLSLSALLALTTAAPLTPRQTVSCVSGLYILVARGSGQAAGEGSVATVADMIEARVPNSLSDAVVYPATFENYFGSVNTGIDNAKSKIRAYVDQCGESSRIALVGFSQGAHVMTDTMAGGTLTQGPIEDGYARYIVAIVAFGDPRYNDGQSYNVGTADNDGIFARIGSLPRLNRYAGILRSYCDRGDPICARGLLADVHSNGPRKYATQAAEFVAGLVN